MNSKTNEAVGQLGAVQQAVRSVYAGQPTYTGLNAQALADTRSLPTKMVVGSGATASLRHAFNGTITVAPAQIAGGSAGNGFSIEFAGLPSARKSTRLNPVTNAHLVFRLLLEKKNITKH